MKNPLHNPLPASLSSECKKAAAILESFINPKLKIDGEIPRKIFVGAKGIAVFTALRVGFLGSIRFGSGLIVARLPDGSWSAPSAMAMGGLGAGGQFGAELTDFVFVLTTDAAVKTFMQSGNLTLGGNISMAVGPVGRSAEAGGVVGTKGGTGVFAYSKTRGLYGGLTVEGGVLAERADANKKLYGRKVRAKELLSGLIPPPPEAGVLIKVLNGDYFLIKGPAEPAAEGAEQSREQNTKASAQSHEGQPQGVLAAAADESVAVGPNAEQTPRTPEPSPEGPEQSHEQNTKASAQSHEGQPQGGLAAAADESVAVGPNAEQTPRTPELSSEGPEQSHEQNPEASAQVPEKQSQGIVAPAPNQLAVVEPSTRDSHSLCHELDHQETAPAAKSKPTTDPNTKEATGDAKASKITHGTHTSNVQEPMATTENDYAVEPSTQLGPKGKEPAAGDMHDTSREPGIPGPIPATERLSDSIETAPSATR
ncbi:hypothetical protein N7517_009406 [Penicillium concentricum]|uniref:Ysc84 actin-binding domain-containing protein n=1 Tax=Penicillium concentricum TaxID=293559 RepID=A0A9W9RHB6_9EURO|nr:uncharacterized protein N7517_009406 [Penicillium concentricum]KAJ5360215.1 hypothetical protein N7517_009406 [Penicillium concentricum]